MYYVNCNKYKIMFAYPFNYLCIKKYVKKIDIQYLKNNLKN